MTTKPNKPVIKAIQSDSKGLHYATRVVVVLVALGAAILSFDALAALAFASGIRLEFTWIWALVIDGFILVATFAAFALKDRKNSGAKIYAWVTLGMFVLFSIMGNAWHASIAREDFVLPLAIAVVVTAIPPLALFLAIHLLILMVSPTHEQKEEYKRLKARADRLRKVEEKELERIEKEAIVQEIRAQKEQIIVPEIITPHEGAIPSDPEPFLKPTPQISSAATPKSSPSTSVIASTPSTAPKTEEEVNQILKTKIEEGQPLPSGKTIGEWLGKSERTGQTYIKKFKANFSSESPSI